MSEATADTPTPAPSTTLDKIKAAAPLALASGGAGFAGGGMLEGYLSDMITDLSTKYQWAWMNHPLSWAGGLLALGGLVYHLTRTQIQKKGNSNGS